MTIKLQKPVLRFVVIFVLFLIVPKAFAAVPVIDFAPVSGVANYPIRIFGSNFGAQSTDTTVKINNTPATIVTWQNTYIEVIIPQAQVGTGNLSVTTSQGTVTQPFQLYEINPKFIQKPADLQDIIIDKPVYYYNSASEYFIGSSPSRILSRHNVFYGGGKVFLNANSQVAVDTGAALNSQVWFTFFGGSSFYPDPAGVPRSYSIEGSNNSTNGLDGSWTTLLSVSGNDRISRTHALNAQGNSWLRLNIATIGNGSSFGLQEIRIHKKVNNADSRQPDALAIIGDSITANDFSLLANSQNMMMLLNAKRNNGTHILPVILGMVGQNASIFTAGNSNGVALLTALKENPDIPVWGMAIGTNDSNNSGQLSSYASNMEDGVQAILALNKTPIIARIPDTSPNGGYGTLQSKKSVLQAIDNLAAKYQLIPGPDFFGVFRYNILFDGASYISDGTHHSYDGGVVTNRMWADTLVQAGIYSGSTPVATPTPLTMSPTTALTPIPSNSPSLPTSPPTPQPTAQPSVKPTPACSTKATGDADCNGLVTLADFELIRSHFGTSTTIGDINNDGTVDNTDYGTWLLTYQKLK